MRWLLAGGAYALAYVVFVSWFAPAPTARMWAGDLGLLLSPLVPIAVVSWRWRRWSGRSAVFWTTLAVGCALWVVGHVGWTSIEILQHRPLPWLEWPAAVKLCGGILPMLALIAWPHAEIRGASIAALVLDISGLAVLSGFLFWSLVVAPGLSPDAASLALNFFRGLGLVLHAALAGSFFYAARRARPGWRETYHRIGTGAVAGALLLMPNVQAFAQGQYATGSPGDIGWIIPFWFYAWAAADAPESQPEPPLPFEHWERASSPGVPILTMMAIVPIAGYVPRFLLPLGGPIDTYRDLATGVTLAAGCALAIARVAVEQRARRRADYRVGLLATACEQSAELIVVVRSRAIEYANKAFRTALGYSLEELRRLDVVTLIAPDSVANIPPVAEAIRRHEIVRTTFGVRRRDNTTFQASCTLAPLVTASSRTVFVVGVVHDLTDDMKARERLVQQERLSAVGALVSGVAHEINNPLQSVLGLTDVLLRQPIDAETRRDLEQIRAQADRAGRIVQALQTFERRAPGERLLVELGDVAHEAVLACASAFEEDRIRCVERYAPRLPLIYANRAELKQAIISLMTNARHALASMPGSRLVTMRTLLLTEGQVALEVADDGPGVPADLAPRIFEPFFSTKPVGEGAGLGLSIAFGIISANGGALSLVPSDRGACFRLSLPSAGVASGPR